MSGGTLAALRLYEPEDPPAVVHATHWKAGSQWIHRILYHCAPNRVVAPEGEGQHLLGCKVERDAIYPCVYGSRSDVAACGSTEDMSVFVVLRDLRDTLTSWYFSVKLSHPIDCTWLPALRKQFLSMSVEDGLLLAIENDQFARCATIQNSWVDAKVPLLRFEDLLERDEELLVPLLTGRCDVGASAERVREAIRACRFECLSGRARGVEDINSHFRRGEAGDWRRHFTSRVAEAFAHRYGDVLKETGYAEDDSWVNDATAVSNISTTVAASTAPTRRHFSVIMLLPEHRGHFAAAIRSWTEAQLYPDDRFELIVACDDSELETQKAATALLRPQDRMLIVPGVKRSGLLDRAARTAQFEQLIFTESHCEADPDFLRELDDWLGRHPNVAGACCRTVPAYENNYAYFDAVLHEEGYRVYRADDDWRKINIHAFTLSRDWFVRAGGLDETYNLFAEMILAARLRDLGGRMGYAAGAAVLHHFRREADGPEESVREFVRDESCYRRDHPGPDRLGFSALPDVSQFTGHAGDTWREAFLAAMHHGLLERRTWRLLPRLAWKAAEELLSVRNPKSAARRATRQILWHKTAARFWRLNRKRLERHFRELWRLYALHERLCALSEETNEASDELVLSRRACSVVQDIGTTAAGLHDSETYKDESFRWTHPVSVWRLKGLTDDCTVCFRTHAVRFDLTAEQLFISCNGRRVPAGQVKVTPEFLSVDLCGIPVDPSDSVVLLVSVPALRPWLLGQPDRRTLGLPVISVGLQGFVEESQKQAA